MGYGLISIRNQEMKLIQYGVIHLGKYPAHELRLKKIFERVVQLVDEYHPDDVALEAPFFGKNVQSMLKLGRAQGVAMAAALSREIPICEYAPRKIKQSVTGNGNASKEQVAQMIMTLLSIQEQPKLLDASDALAVAVCHYFSKNSLKSTRKTPAPKKSSGWGAYLKNNPGKIKRQ